MDMILVNLFVKIFLAGTFINLLLNRFFNYSNNIMSCGIWGYSGVKPPNLAKMKLLGMYNTARGKHSCGYYYDGVLRHGIDKTKEWPDFIVDGLTINKEGSKGAKVFVGHTRSATKGAQVLRNAHPFLVDGLVQTHNGTLENFFDLCDKYGINHKEINVDSLALSHLIRKEGFKVLEEYIGYAANMWIFEDEPDALYVWHGASRTKRNDEKSYEERPLYYLQSKGELYFSSMPESLMAIREKETEEPKILAHNKVFKAVNGKFKEVVYTVKRADNNLDFLDPVKRVESTRKTSSSAYYQPVMFPADEKPVSFSPILREKEPKEAQSIGRVYFHKGRYWRKCIADNRTYALQLNGKVRISKDGWIVEHDKRARKVKEYWFTDGIMLRNQDAYKKVVILSDIPSTPLAHRNRVAEHFAYHMSRFSKYPITACENESLNVLDNIRFRWYYDEKFYTGLIEPEFTSRKYGVREGKLFHVGRNEGDPVFTDTPIIKPVTHLDIRYNTNENIINKYSKIINLSESAEEAQIMTYFHCNWLNMQEVEDLPLPVYAAIEAYIDDVLDQRGLEELPQREKDEYYQDFIKTTIDEQLTFYQNMDKDFQCNLAYYIQIGIKDVKEAEKKDAKIEEARAMVQETFHEMDAKGTPTEIYVSVKDNETVDDSSVEELDKQIESEEAVRQFDEVIEKIIQLRKLGDKMQLLNKSDVAQNIAFTIYQTVDSFKVNAVNNIKEADVNKRIAWIDTPF